MIRKKIREDKLPLRLKVVLSNEVRQHISDVYNYNYNNKEGLSQWYEFLNEMWKYISKRTYM